MEEAEGRGHFGSSHATIGSRKKASGVDEKHLRQKPLYCLLGGRWLDVENPWTCEREESGARNVAEVGGVRNGGSMPNAAPYLLALERCGGAYHPLSRRNQPPPSQTSSYHPPSAPSRDGSISDPSRHLVICPGPKPPWIAPDESQPLVQITWSISAAAPRRHP